jgi:hypothetical protein
LAAELVTAALQVANMFAMIALKSEFVTVGRVLALKNFLFQIVRYTHFQIQSMMLLAHLSNPLAIHYAQLKQPSPAPEKKS